MSKKMNIPLIHENTIQNYHSATKEDFKNNYKQSKFYAENRKKFIGRRGVPSNTIRIMPEHVLHRIRGITSGAQTFLILIRSQNRRAPQIVPRSEHYFGRVFSAIEYENEYGYWVDSQF